MIINKRHLVFRRYLSKKAPKRREAPYISSAPFLKGTERMRGTSVFVGAFLNRYLQIKRYLFFNRYLFKKAPTKKTVPFMKIVLRKWSRLDTKCEIFIIKYLPPFPLLLLVDLEVCEAIHGHSLDSRLTAGHYGHGACAYQIQLLSILLL